MAEATIPVDLFNPGQVFACLGLVEAAEVLLGDAAGRFAWQDDTATFTVVAAGEENPVAAVLEFLSAATVTALRPHGSTLDAGQRVKTCDYLPAGTFPTAPPDTKARLIALLSTEDGRAIEVSYWGDVPGRARSKFWGGNRTAPGITQRAIRCLTGVDPADPFRHQATCGGVFRFDPRGSYLPIDTGFSLNEHKKTITVVGYPVTEILAAMGMTFARPMADHKVSYRYTVLGNTPNLPLAFLRAMLGSHAAIVPGAETRRFEFFVASPGESSEEYCITDVQELPEEARS